MKNNLESARWDWDKEEMWADIEQHLPPAKEPKRILPIWWITGVLALGLISAFIIIPNLNNSTYAKNEIAKINKADVNKVESILTEQNDDLNTKNQSILSVDNPENNDDLIESQIRKNQSTLKNAKQVNSNSSEAKSDNAIEINISKDKTSGSIKSDLDSSSDSGLNQFLGSFVLNSSEDENQNIKNIKEESRDGSDARKKSALEEMIDRHNSSFVQSRISSLDYVNGINVYLSIPVRRFQSPLIQINDSEFIKPINRNWISSFSLYSNYSSLNRTLSNTSIESSLFEQRVNSEKTLEAIGAQLNYRVNFNRNIFAEVGVEYQRINEVMNFQEEVLVQEVVPSDSAFYFVNFMGETQYVAGDQTKRSIERTAFNSYNEHHFVNMPIHIGYSKNLGRFALNVVGGPVLNIYQSYKGDSIGEDLTFVKDRQVNDFNNSILSAFDAGLYLDYGLTKSLSLSSGINYRKSLSNFTIDGVINQSYDVIDFKLGILFKI